MEQQFITYVFKYMTPDNKFIGYHYDSFCTTGKDIKEAKRYGGYLKGNTPDLQLKTIRNNFEYLCDQYTEGKFKGYPKEQIILIYEELAPQIIEAFPQEFIFKLSNTEENEQ